MLGAIKIALSKLILHSTQKGANWAINRLKETTTWGGVGIIAFMAWVAENGDIIDWIVADWKRAIFVFISAFLIGIKEKGKSHGS